MHRFGTMKPAVQKYGGSSLAGESKVRRVAERIIETHSRGRPVVVVVSAMGNTTTSLLDRARDVTSDPCLRELDMLLSSGEQISMSLVALAVRDRGVEAISLTGPQAGIRTDGHHFHAGIVDVRPERVRVELERGRVVVVAGYQGSSPEGEMTTLGRGGSDTTAVALAAALEAENCEICSDVDGVYSADPRLVPDAAPLEILGYDEMLAMARHGSSVLNPRAVEWAARESVELVARSTFDPAPGTRVRNLPATGEGRVVGVACHRRILKLSVSDECLSGGVVEEALERAGEPTVLLDDCDPSSGRRDLLIPAGEVVNPDRLASELSSVEDRGLEVESDLGSVSILGLDVGRSGARLHRARSTLEEAGLQVHASYNSNHALTCLVSSERIESATRLLHHRFVEQRNVFEVAS